MLNLCVFCFIYIDIFCRCSFGESGVKQYQEEVNLYLVNLCLVPCNLVTGVVHFSNEDSHWIHCSNCLVILTCEYR